MPKPISDVTIEFIEEFLEKHKDLMKDLAELEEAEKTDNKLESKDK